VTSGTIIVTYDDLDGAKAALEGLRQMEKQNLAKIEDAVIVRKEPDGKVKVKETKDVTTSKGAVSGGILGVVVGTILGGPIGGLAVGAVLGALAGKATDLGVSDDQVKMLSEKLEADHSALLAQVSSEHVDLVASGLRQSGGHVIESTFTDTTKLDTAGLTGLTSTGTAGGYQHDAKF